MKGFTRRLPAAVAFGRLESVALRSTTMPSLSSPWPRFPFTLLLVLAVLALRPADAAAQGAEGLRPCLKELAGKLDKFLKGKKETRIAVGELRATGDESLSPGLQKILAEELKAKGLNVTASAGLKVRGEY